MITSKRISLFLIFTMLLIGGFSLDATTLMKSYNPGINLVPRAAAPSTAGAGDIYFDSTGTKLRLYTGSGWSDVGSGSGSGGINYITNSGLETDASGYVAYADAAGTGPVDGTGGSPSVTCTRTTSSPLRGGGSLLITKGATNRQGDGCSYDFTADSADSLASKVVRINFDISASANFVAGDSSDIRIYIYDITNSAIRPVAQPTLNVATGQYQSTVSLSSTSTSYRLIFHVATTNASAWTAKIDNVTVGPQDVFYGPAQTDWQAYTPTISAGFGTTSNVSFFYRRVGAELEVRGTFTSGTVAGSLGTFTLPTGLALDTTKISIANTSAAAGPQVGYIQNSVAANQFGPIVTATGTSTALVYTGANTAQVNNLIPTNVSTSFNSSSVASIYFKVPISGWSTNVVAANSSVIRIADILANGTRVTTTPAALGEWRALRKTNGSAITSADIAPSTNPTSADGIKIWSIAGNGTPGANDANKYEIYVGRNKVIRYLWYTGTGRTGSFDPSVWVASSAWQGIFTTAQPDANGNVFIEAIPNGTGFTVSALGAQSVDGTTAAALFTGPGYFDILVSDNALTVQQQNGVTSTYSGMSNMEYAVLNATCTSGTCAQTSGSGGLVVTWTATGKYNVSYSGKFSQVPSCQCNTHNLGRVCGEGDTSDLPTSSSVNIHTFTPGGADANNPFSIICVGPK